MVEHRHSGDRASRLGSCPARMLRDDKPPKLRPRRSDRHSGLWYHRLCRALSDQAVVGSMSRRLGKVEMAVAADAVAAVIDLPDTIELLSLRTLGWPMARHVHSGARLNLLSLEAIVAAKHLRADICLAELDDNEPLRRS